MVGRSGVSSAGCGVSALRATLVKKVLTARCCSDSPATETNSSRTDPPEQDSCRHIPHCAGLACSCLCDQADFAEQQETSGRLVGETERKKRGLEVEVEKVVKTD